VLQGRSDDVRTQQRMRMLRRLQKKRRHQRRWSRSVVALISEYILQAVSRLFEQS
jgi:hypothetical protein